MGELRNTSTYGITVVKSEGKRHFGRSVLRWEHVVIKIGWEVAD
jgi:hypothetical protein